MDLQQAFATFSAPPREFGPIPFWFLNDDLEEEELLRQLHAFHDAHYGGFVLHARVGLSHRVGYLTEEFFRLARRLVAEADRLGMKVILYDEGSYPSGSAQGAVVAENPRFASQAMGLWQRTVEGPYVGYWRPNTGRALLDRHICTVIGRQGPDGAIDPRSVRVLEALPHDIVRIEVADGRWTAMSVWNTASGGNIRGVFPEEEDGSLTAPPAGDILNPDAVACFLRLTHDRYYEHLQEFFGSTIIAMFTDEPQIMGRHPLRPADPRHYTPGLIEWLAERWGEDPRPWLPALWLDYGPGSAAFRRKFDSAIQQRLEEVFFAAQSRWCADHGIALTGHPAESGELSPLRYFQLPGQDMVWRYVEPDRPTAIEGRHSVAAKVATSGARIQGARRILTEVCGAYGWRLTLEEMKWLFRLAPGARQQPDRSARGVLLDPRPARLGERARPVPAQHLAALRRPDQPLRAAPELAAVRRPPGVPGRHPRRRQRHAVAGRAPALPEPDRLSLPGRGRGGAGRGRGRDPCSGHPGLPCRGGGR